MAHEGSKKEKQESRREAKVRRIFEALEVPDLAAAQRRYWRKVDSSAGPDSCWPWTGYVAPDGYGQLSLTGPDGKQSAYGAHRVSYLFSRGVLPPDGQVVRHMCAGGGNPLCCNPRHLESGTHKDNAADREQAGRGRRARMVGETNGSAKLTEADVLEIRATPHTYGSDAAFARRFGVSSRIIGLIRTGQRWRHVPMPGRDAEVAA